MCCLESILLVARVLQLLWLILTNFIEVFLTILVLVLSFSMVRPRTASAPWSVVFSSGWRSRYHMGVAHTLPVVGMTTLSARNWAAATAVTFYATFATGSRMGSELCRFPWTGQHWWMWWLFLQKPWNLACCPCPGGFLLQQSCGFWFFE